MPDETRGRLDRRHPTRCLLDRSGSRTPRSAYHTARTAADNPNLARVPMSMAGGAGTGGESAGLAPANPPGPPAFLPMVPPAA